MNKNPEPQTNSVGNVADILKAEATETAETSNSANTTKPESQNKSQQEQVVKPTSTPQQKPSTQPSTKPVAKNKQYNSGVGSTSTYKSKKRGFYIGGVSDLKLAFAFRHLGIMLKSGLALEGAITILSQQLDDQRLKDIFSEMLLDIGNGTTIADSMRKHKDVFPNLVISLISSGEQGGTLNENLFILADYLKKSNELKQKVKGALIYPLIVLGMTSFEILGVVYFLLPRLDSMFSAFGDVPDFTRVVLDVSKFIRDNTVALAIGIVVLAIVGNYYFSKTKAGKHAKDVLSLNFPVFKNLNKNNILSTFSQTFSLLLKNAIPINDALQIAAETNDNTVYIEALGKIQERVMAGQSLSAAMMEYQTLFPFTYIKMLEIGEETSSLADTLQYVHEFYAEEALEISNNLATLLEPILLIFIGVMIGGLAMIIIGPIYQLMGTINQ